MSSDILAKLDRELDTYDDPPVIALVSWRNRVYFGVLTSLWPEYSPQVMLVYTAHHELSDENVRTIRAQRPQTFTLVADPDMNLSAGGIHILRRDDDRLTYLTDEQRTYIMQNPASAELNASVL